MSRYKAVIMDLDGTLIDTAPGIIACATDVLIRMGAPVPSDEEFAPFIGPPLPECFRLVTGREEAFCLEAAEHYKEMFGPAYTVYFKLYPGMAELLEKCRENGILLGVATYKQPNHMRSSLDRFGITEYFCALEGQDAMSTLTKSQIIDRAVEAMGITDKKAVLMVGDSWYDYEGAQGSGTDFAAAAYGYGFDAENAPGDVVVKDVFELTDYIFSQT